jgi:hypothetical protein
MGLDAERLLTAESYGLGRNLAELPHDGGPSSQQSTTAMGIRGVLIFGLTGPPCARLGHLHHFPISGSKKMMRGGGV